jgi:hypothetical protein
MVMQHVKYIVAPTISYLVLQNSANVKLSSELTNIISIQNKCKYIIAKQKTIERWLDLYRANRSFSIINASAYEFDGCGSNSGFDRDFPPRHN